MGLSITAYSTDIILPDEPEFQKRVEAPNKGPDSYEQALKIWRTVWDINKWVADNFKYDRNRAIVLSSDQKAKSTKVSIQTPAELFENRSGVCVDLARFGVETLGKITSETDPKFLMIEFVPIQINGSTFRLHWLVSFKKRGMKYFFCDSKRPDHIAGPYENTQGFIEDYAQYRGRKIVSYRELASYKKQRKLEAKKVKRNKSNEKYIQ